MTGNLHLWFVVFKDDPAMLDVILTAYRLDSLRRIGLWLALLLFVGGGIPQSRFF